ncbi:MAG: pilus assembly protein PilP [Deltaproteobacteria bacterium]|nr:pilus assembly protein PilP [Deltaproteobacteria bacterium]
MSLKPKNKIRRNSLILLFVSLFFVCFYARAAQEVFDQKETGEEVLEVAVSIDSEKSADKGKDDFFYDPRGKTDPFKSFIAIQEEMEEMKKRKPRTYLETVELSQLQLTAIISSEKESWAMVRDSKGLGHVIKKGTYIGTDGGVVHEIKNKEIIIREEYRDFRGNTKYRDQIKRLPSPM